MGREIKFRAWDGESMSQNTKSIQDIANSGVSSRDSDKLIWLQYTGLKDKNGKEIYEGDIIQDDDGEVMVVGWSDKFASFCLDKDGWAFQHWFGEAVNPQNVIIIGNIYEHPELIK